MISSSLYANHFPTFNMADLNAGLNWDVNNRHHKSLKIYFSLWHTHTHTSFSVNALQCWKIHVIEHFLAEYKQGLKIGEDTGLESLEMQL